MAENPKHDYGHSLMALAETQAAQGEFDGAINSLQRVLVNHSYARARVQLAELLVRQSRNDEARAELTEVLADEPHSPAFQRHRDRVWIRRAKGLLRHL